MRPQDEIRVLLVSEDDSLIGVTRHLIDSVGHLHLVTVSGVDHALAALGRGDVGLALIHQAGATADAGAAQLVRVIAASGRALAAVVISDEHRAEQALALLKLGAADYLSRPLDLNRLAFLIDVLTLRARYTAARPRPVAEEADVVRETADGEPFLYLMDHPMGRLMGQVRRVAPQNVNVLLGGETGTGKTRMARLIHELSDRRDAPFLVVNCGALSATLIESEMFGHAQGAFTGADRNKVGKFEEVGRGTLLLDEIDSLPLSLQAKLLRAVEERVFEPVGSNQSRPMQARLIAASNRDLDQEVAAGRFRADLYYRLNVVSFEVPPLRERPGVIGPLARQFVVDAASRNHQPARALAPDALRALESYPWPGNIRQLRNVIERAVVLCHGPVIGLDDLPDELHAALPSAVAAPPPKAVAAAMPTTNTLSETRDLAELERIGLALKKHANNRLRAAAELGISRMTLYKKLHKYGIMST